MKTLLVAINSQYIHTNLAVRGLCAYARKHGADADFIEMSINEPTEKILSALFARKADCYAFSCYIWNMETVKKVASSVKKMLPDCRIVLGGPEVTFCAEEIMEQMPFVDTVIAGEGETALLQLEEKCGVIYGEKLPLDELPFPYEVGLPDGYQSRILYYETSRGCPYACGYCLSSADRGVRFLDEERVKKELSFFIENRVPLVKFVDRTFNADTARARRIWRFLIENAAETEFHFEIAADLITEEDIALLSTAPQGLFRFEAGVQSTNAETLRRCNRSTGYDKLASKLRALAKLDNVHLHVDLIAGLPGETEESFIKGFDEVALLGAECVQLGFLKLLKGTRLRNESEQFGASFSDWPPYEVISTDTMSAEVLQRLKKLEWANETLINSGKFSCTVALLRQNINSATEMLFGFYDCAARYGLVDAPFSRERLYETVYGFARDICGELAADTLKYDFMRSGSRKGAPAFIPAVELDEKAKALSRDRKEKIVLRKYGFDTELYRREKRIEAASVTEIYTVQGSKYLFEKIL